MSDADIDKFAALLVTGLRPLTTHTLSTKRDTMSETQDRMYKIIWRTVNAASLMAPSATEGATERTIAAAYYRRIEDRFVFKHSDGTHVFDVAADLVETIELVSG